MLKSTKTNIEKLILLATHMGYKYMLYDVCSAGVINNLEKFNSMCLVPMAFLNSSCERIKDKWLVITEVKTKSEFMKYSRWPNVNAILLSIENLHKILDYQSLHIVNQYYKYIIIDFTPLIKLERNDRMRLIKQIRKKGLYYLNKIKPRYIFTILIDSLYDLISPRQLRALLLLLGIKDHVIKRATKINSKSMIIAPSEATELSENFREIILKNCLI